MRNRTEDTVLLTRGLRAGSFALIALLLVAQATCTFLDDLLDVSAPDRIIAEDYEVPDNARALVAGAVADFECSFTAYIVGTSLTGNIFRNSMGPVIWRGYDRRVFEPNGYETTGFAYNDCEYYTAPERLVGIYRPLSTARWQADHVLNLLEGWSDEQVPNRTALIAEAAAYAGYSYLLLGEAMCAAAFDGGEAMFPPEIFGLAVERFSKAMTNAESAGSAPILNMARVGRARALLNLGRPQEAAADAQAVPRGFVKNATYSTASRRRENAVFLENRDHRALVREPYLDLGRFDPRVRVHDTGEVTSVGVPIYFQMKYENRDSPIPIARWEEAQLIIAEAELDGDPQVSVQIINELRQPWGLPAFTSTDRNEILQQIIYERDAELFLESHHLHDLKRYNLPLDPSPGTPFIFGGVYGDHVCYPLPGIEIDNNPNAQY